MSVPVVQQCTSDVFFVFCFLQRKKKADLIHTCQSKCLNQAKVRTYKFSCYCQTDLGLNLSSNNYYKSLNFSSLSLPFCSKGSMTLLRLESRKKGWVQEESLFRIRGFVLPPHPPTKKNWGGNWNAFYHQFWHPYVFCRPLIWSFFHNKIIIQRCLPIDTKAE